MDFYLKRFSPHCAASLRIQMMKKFLSRPFLRIFLIVLAAAVFLVSELFLFRLAFSNPDMSLETQYNILLSTIIVFLCFAALLLVWALKNWGYGQKPWVTLIAAYGLPLFAFLVSYVWLRYSNSSLVAGRLVGSYFWATWHPILYVWQVLVLLFSLWLLFPRQDKAPKIEGSHILAGLLAGLGSGLVSVFIISVISNYAAQQAMPLTMAQPASLLRWLTIILSLTLAPIALEGFFRQVLIRDWQIRYGAQKGFWLVALLFALLTFQPALWLPAFISAVVFAFLAQSQSFAAAVMAHTLGNALLLLVGWQWVF
jgi:membrane protease YdiL (CAAX protease family)